MLFNVNNIIISYISMLLYYYYYYYSETQFLRTHANLQVSIIFLGSPSRS